MTRHCFIWVTLAAIFTVVMRPSNAVAQAGNTSAAVVVLVHLDTCCPASTWPAAEKRIQTELSLCGLNLTDMNAPANSVPPYGDLLTQALRQHAARGAILVSVTPDQGAVLHSVFSMAGSDTPEYREHPLTVTPSDGTIEVAALKAREAVLAALYPQSLRDRSLQHAPVANAKTEASDPAAAPATEHPPTPGPASSRHRLSTTAYLGAIWAPGGAGAMGLLGAAIAMHPTHRIFVGVTGDMTVLSRDITGDNASASVQLLMGRLQLGFLFPRSGPVSPAVGVQMGLAYFRSRGKSDLFPVQQSHAILFTGGVFGQLSFRLSKHIHIPLTLGVGALPPGIAVRFAKKTQATLHTLLIEGNLGVAIRF